MKELGEDFINQLLTKPKRGKPGMSLDDPDNRNILIWIKLPHTLAFCHNPECPDDRPRKVAEGNAMCTLIHDKAVCRLCFLSGYLLPSLDNPAPGV